MAQLGTRDVGEVALGTAKFAFGDGSFEQSIATVKAAMEAGVVLLDTALAYTRPEIESYAESVVSEALRRFGADHVAVATKGGHWREGDRFPVDDRPDLPMAAHCADKGALYLAYQPFDGYRTQPSAVVQQVADRIGVSVNRVMLAWLRAQSPAILPIVGASRPETIRDSATAVELAPEDLAELESQLPSSSRHGT